MLQPAVPPIAVRVLIQGARGSVEELRFTAVGSDDTLLVKLRERSDAYDSGAAGGVALKITRLPDDPRLKPLTELQRGRLVAQGRLAASRNRSRPRRLRRMAR